MVFKLLKMKRGFTIIELLVSLGIFVIITTMVVANFRAGSRSDELKIAADALSSDLRRAQNMALAGQEVNGVTPTGGYGVYFDLGEPGHYIIFADANDNQKYDVGEDLSDGKIVLARDVRITGIQPLVTSSVVFKPPKPTIYINGDAAESILAVTIKHSLSGKEKKVVINRVSGRIDVE